MLIRPDLFEHGAHALGRGGHQCAMRRHAHRHRVLLHATLGSRVMRAWGLILRKRFCRQFNFELQAAALEDCLIKAVPIYLCSLGVAVAFRLQIWNIGAEGQLYMGAMGATADCDPRRYGSTTTSSSTTWNGRQRRRATAASAPAV